MHNHSQAPYNTPAPKKKGKAIRVLLPLLLVLAAVIVATLPTIRSAYHYVSATMLLELGEYEQAAEQFSQLPDQQDMAKQCYYLQAGQEYHDGDLESAIAFFELAEDYENAGEWRRKCIYELGHECFLQGEYDRAEEYFNRLNGEYPKDGALHFPRFADAVEYFQQQAAGLEEEMECFVGEMPQKYIADEDALWEAMSNYIPFQVGAVEYTQEDHSLYVSATYYPGSKVVYAWQTGDDSVLTQEEKEVMGLALSLTEQARSESETQLETQIWLYDWLCEHMEYENPDMDVPEEKYLKLRQLTCVGALLDGKANCQGYTDAFYLLGTLAGFDVCRIGGVSEEPHSWNGIMLDGKRYIVDVTFGDVAEMDEQAKLYVWFNCSYDPDCYTIDGGAELFPELVTENDLSQSFYAHEGSVFESIDEAALYLLRQYKENGEGWSYAVVKDCELTSEDLFEAIDDNLSKANVWSVSWTEVIETYDGNTHLSIRWE